MVAKLLIKTGLVYPAAEFDIISVLLLDSAPPILLL